MQGHSDLSVERPGLITHSEYGYIRGSPDVVIRCSCCPDAHLGEIKCPFKGRDKAVIDLFENGDIDYIFQNASGLHELKRSLQRGYYYQIKLIMAVCNLKLAYFVIWTSITDCRPSVRYASSLTPNEGKAIHSFSIGIA